MKDKEITNVIIVGNPSLHQDILRNTSRQFMTANKIINVSNLKKLYCRKKNPLKNKEISFLRNTIRENIGATIHTLKGSKHMVKCYMLYVLGNSCQGFDKYEQAHLR